MEDAAGLIARHSIAHVECFVTDLNGIARGKVIPAQKFLKALEDRALFLPSSAFLLSVEGRYTGHVDVDFGYQDPDMRLVPDLSTLCVSPSASVPTALVIADPFHMDGRPWMASPRQVLRAVLSLYAARGWRPMVAPEVEFYLCAPNPDPNQPLKTPVGPNGRAEAVQHPYDLQALGQYDSFIRRLYDYAKAANLPVDTLIHESGSGQLEINMLHGDAIELADKVVLFKRLARDAAAKDGAQATFMAKPLPEHAGSSMHLHVSLVDGAGRNLFADASGNDTEMFEHFIGGLQTYLPETVPLYAPNPNSYRRIRPGHSAPANVEWSHDNRTCGLRVPLAAPVARRIENRLPGADADPYLALAGTLLCGYLGVEEKRQRTAEAFGNAYRKRSTLPRGPAAALERLANCEPVRKLLGEDFYASYLRVKEVELDIFEGVVTPWERDHLFTKV